MSSYHKLHTPHDTDIAFIDSPPQMIFGVTNIDRNAQVHPASSLHQPDAEHSN